MDPVLLDTDILSELLKLRDPVVQQRAAAYVRTVGPITFSAMTRYEVTRGFKDLGATTQLARFEVFCRQAMVLAVTDAIFDRAADLWATGKKAGHPHNDADLIIAATAIEHALVLVTGNTAHFAWIPGMHLEEWRKP